jgi:hypothetical protein
MNTIFVSWISAYLVVLVGAVLTYIFTPDKKGESFENW